MHTFEFSTSSKIIFGCGAVKKIGNLCAGLGKRALVISSTSAPIKMIESELKGSNSKWESFIVSGEPTYEEIEKNIKLLRSIRPDLVIGIGGGSALDYAKAVSALLANEGDLLDYLEVVGKSMPLSSKPVPMIAIPTTAGTGTEVTKNAVIKLAEKGLKVSLRNEMLIPRVALIDPELTLDLPPQVTASTGMDALVQVIEPYLSLRSNPFTDLFCISGIKAISANLFKAFSTPKDITAREQMSFGSLMGGLSLANAGLGAVHGFAAVLGGMYPVPHGECCASMLTAVFTVNHKALLERDAHNPILGKFDEIAKIVTGNQKSKTADGVKWFEELNHKLNISTLSKYDIKKEDYPRIIEGVKASSSMKTNPVQLNEGELNRILSQSM